MIFKWLSYLFKKKNNSGPILIHTDLGFSIMTKNFELPLPSGRVQKYFTWDEVRKLYKSNAFPKGWRPMKLSEFLKLRDYYGNKGCYDTFHFRRGGYIYEKDINKYHNTLSPKCVNSSEFCCWTCTPEMSLRDNTKYNYVIWLKKDPLYSYHTDLANLEVNNAYQLRLVKSDKPEGDGFFEI